MLRFKQFISEQNLEKTPAEIAALIFKDCQAYLKESNYDPAHPEKSALLRGMKGLNKVPLKLDTIKNRQPTDTNTKVNNTLREFFRQKFGYDFRADSVFCVASRETATGYSGSNSANGVYYIFPIGEFRYAWSKVVEDAYTYFDYKTQGGYPLIANRISYEPYFKEYLGGENYKDKRSYDTTSYEWQKVLKQYFEENNCYIVDRGLTEYFKSFAKNEIMIGCDSFYAIPYFLHEEIFEELAELYK